MNKAFQDVLNFHRVTGGHIGEHTTLPPKKVKKRRKALIKEEYRRA